MSTKIERSTSLPSTPKISGVPRAAVTAVTTPANGTPAPEVSGSFSAEALKKELIPAGKHISKSADPGSLWGATIKADDLDPEAFLKLPPQEQRARIHELRERRDELGAEIQARVAELEKKWRYSRLVTRTEALRDYQDQSKHLDGTSRHRLDAALDKSEAAQQRINRLLAEAAKLKGLDKNDPVVAEQRKKLAAELRRARSEQSDAVKVATEVVDDQGLKVDRLAVTEQIIDPNAPKPGSGGSLLEKIAKFFHLDFLINTVQHFIDFVSHIGEKKQVEAKREQEQDQARARQLASDLKKRLDREQADFENLEKQLALLRSFVSRAQQP